MGTRRSRHNRGRKPLYKSHGLPDKTVCEGCGTAFRPTSPSIKRCDDCLPARDEPQANFRLVKEVKSLTPSDARDLNKDDAYDAFKMLRWGWEDGHVRCRCGSASIYEYASRRIFKCARCGQQFSVTSGTVFHARKLAHKDILTALSTTLHDPKNPHALSVDMGINYRSAVRLMKGFRLFVGNIELRAREARWPYLPSAPETEIERIMLRVAETIPRDFPEQVRADVGQEMVLGLLAGDFSEDQLRIQVRKYINGHYKVSEFNKFRDLSLDQPVPGTDGLSWYEVLHGSSLAEGRIDGQSNWMTRFSNPDQFEETLRQEIEVFAAEQGWSFGEAVEWLEAEDFLEVPK